MGRRSRTDDPQSLLVRLSRHLDDFHKQLQTGTLRDQVRSLVPTTHVLRDLGGSLLSANAKSSGRERILAYLRANTGVVIAGEELMVVAGIGDYPRRIRELRKELGWPILSGVTAKQMRLASEDNGPEAASLLPPPMKTDDYMLIEDRRDEEAANRWNVANEIRRRKDGVQAKVLAYFRANIGKPVTGEELRYVANEKNEWPRRTRELRTEEGWPIVTRFSGDPTLPMGVYRLAEDKQSPPHDRHIKEITRREVMERDHWQCQWRGCGWSNDRAAFDQRFLEVHHITHHVSGGTNEADNLVTLCNLHHDEVHRSGELDLSAEIRAILNI